MAEYEVDRELLEKIADMLGKPVGAFNIRKDSGCDSRQSTENIQITNKEDKPGIDIRIKAGTKGETCHIPVIITKSDLEEMVYNDFFIGEDCDVDIVAGCAHGIDQQGADGGAATCAGTEAPQKSMIIATIAPIPNHKVARPVVTASMMNITTAMASHITHMLTISLILPF